MGFDIERFGRTLTCGARGCTTLCRRRGWQFWGLVSEPIADVGADFGGERSTG